MADCLQRQRLFIANLSWLLLPYLHAESAIQFLHVCCRCWLFALLLLLLSSYAGEYKPQKQQPRNLFSNIGQFACVALAGRDLKHGTWTWLGPGATSTPSRSPRPSPHPILDIPNAINVQAIDETRRFIDLNAGRRIFFCDSRIAQQVPD